MWAERSGILLEPNDIAKRIRFVSTALPPGIPPLPDGGYFPRYLPVIQSIALKNPTVRQALHPDTLQWFCHYLAVAAQGYQSVAPAPRLLLKVGVFKLE
jgi:hypothetical protein